MNHSTAARDPMWRVSVATYNRLLFNHPQNGTLMLALERKATVKNVDGEAVHVWSQPFGGAVRILDPGPLQEIVGEIQFDCDRSECEQDFRILIAASQWKAVKQYCLEHFENPGDTEIEWGPDRELREEFAGAIAVNLEPDQYSYQPSGFVIENHPVPTDNIYAPGRPTVRLYRIFEVHILDEALSEAILAAGQQYSDQDLGSLALIDFQNGGKGRVNSVLSLPLDRVMGSYLSLAPDTRHGKIRVDDHELDESVLAVLRDIDVPQYERVP